MPSGKFQVMFFWKRKKKNPVLGIRSQFFDLSKLHTWVNEDKLYTSLVCASSLALVIWCQEDEIMNFNRWKHTLKRKWIMSRRRHTSWLTTWVDWLIKSNGVLGIPGVSRVAIQPGFLSHLAEEASLALGCLSGQKSWLDCCGLEDWVYPRPLTS